MKNIMSIRSNFCCCKNRLPTPWSEYKFRYETLEHATYSDVVTNKVIDSFPVCNSQFAKKEVCCQLQTANCKLETTQHDHVGTTSAK